MKHIKPEQIPDFTDFAEFCWWYISQGMFFKPVGNIFDSIQISEKTSETIVFRHGRFQVEMYVIQESPDFFVELHYHPNVKTYEYMLVPGLNPEAAPMNTPLRKPKSVEEVRTQIFGEEFPHGGNKSLLNLPGFILFVFQQWDEGVEVGHISTHNYKGWVLSDQHLGLVQKISPNVYFEKRPNPNGKTDVYIDTTKTL